MQIFAYLMEDMYVKKYKEFLALNMVTPIITTLWESLNMIIIEKENSQHKEDILLTSDHDHH